MMDTEADYNEGTAQYIAIEAMLHAVDRTVTPWLIVAGHRPMYLSSKYPEPSADVSFSPPMPPSRPSGVNDIHARAADLGA